MRVLITGAKGQLATVLTMQASCNSRCFMSLASYKQSLARQSVDQDIEPKSSSCQSSGNESNPPKYSDEQRQMMSRLFANIERLVESDWQVLCLQRKDCDVTSETAVNHVFHTFMPQVVINCAAFNRVDEAEEKPCRAQAVNGEGVELLAKWCVRIAAKLVHISSDYVFDGQANNKYSPQSKTAPLSAYGRSKLSGEQLIAKAYSTESTQARNSKWMHSKQDLSLNQERARQQDLQAHDSRSLTATGIVPEPLIIRTAWLYSPYGDNFVKTMLRLQRDCKTLNIVADQMGSPTWADALAVMIWRAVRAGLSGLYHYGASNTCTWFELASKIQAFSNEQVLQCEGERSIEQVDTSSCQLIPISLAEYRKQQHKKGRVFALRPLNSSLESSTIHQHLAPHVGGNDAPNAHQWQTQLQMMLKFMGMNNERHNC
ncbi:SDR family oxidoreductase [Shewanella gelidii]|uniref:SDR family oxidoreductase n=1 Tax=Shewanella gelidii TaxID=1642821 RepID=UPI0016673871|nr:sugar nucleotide-binding protein [Shewanella gelidii]MCL1096388.1 NAD(P)-dependent oxidoreductase [Shewanella gelidii]